MIELWQNTIGMDDVAQEERWHTAQEYERDYWAKVAEKIAREESNRLDYYDWRSNQLIDMLDECGRERLTDGDARILEIGAGPIGVAPFFPARQRIVVDPLEGF